MTDNPQTNTTSTKQSVSRSDHNLNDAQPRLRSPVNADASAIHQLISRCPPLDLNSVYAYLLLTEHFSRTCVVAETGGQLMGFVSAYIPPEKPDVLFIWQVAVHEAARGKGLGPLMLADLLARPDASSLCYIETTVSPDNVASRAMFKKLADHLGTSIHETHFFDQSLFGESAHEEERLLRIGPFSGARS